MHVRAGRCPVRGHWYTKITRTRGAVYICGKIKSALSLSERERETKGWPTVDSHRSVFRSIKIGVIYVYILVVCNMCVTQWALPVCGCDVVPRPSVGAKAERETEREP